MSHGSFILVTYVGAGLGTTKGNGQWERWNIRDLSGPNTYTDAYTHTHTLSHNTHTYTHMRM